MLLRAPPSSVSFTVYQGFLMTMYSRQQWEDSAQQWPELIRVLLVAIPNFQPEKKETPNEQVSAYS
jgi:hypothetical protein